MRNRARPSQAARATGLLALGALAVHELRYVLAYGGDAHQAMATQGHGYLCELTPAILVLALSAVLGRLAAAGAGRPAGGSASAPLRGSALFFALGLAAIFSAQELAEGVLFAGHPGGIAAILANGGWIALPVAAVIGGLAALADRLLASTERVLALRARRRLKLPRPASSRGRGAGSAPLATPAAARPLAFGLARRPPPAALAS